MIWLNLEEYCFFLCIFYVINYKVYNIKFYYYKLKWFGWRKVYILRLGLFIIGFQIFYYVGDFFGFYLIFSYKLVKISNILSIVVMF